MKLKRLKKNMVAWIKKISYNSDIVTTKTGLYCPNFGTRCCLTCNRCWGEKKQNQNK